MAICWLVLTNANWVRNLEEKFTLACELQNSFQIWLFGKNTQCFGIARMEVIKLNSCPSALINMQKLLINMKLKAWIRPKNVKYDALGWSGEDSDLTVMGWELMKELFNAISFSRAVHIRYLVLRNTTEVLIYLQTQRHWENYIQTHIQTHFIIKWWAVKAVCKRKSNGNVQCTVIWVFCLCPHRLAPWRETWALRTTHNRQYTLAGLSYYHYTVLAYYRLKTASTQSTL